MEYLIGIGLVILAAMAIMFFYNRRLRERAIQQILERLLLKSQSKQAHYSTRAVRKAAHALNKLSKPRLQPLFADLRQGKIRRLLKELDEHTAHRIRAFKAKNAPDKLGQAEAALAKANPQKAAKILEQVVPADKYEQARISYLQAQIALSEGDLLSASEQAARAAKTFQRLKCVYEEAQTYLLSGTIYRAGAVTDTADFMLRTAAELFAFIGANAKQAEVLGYQGMLMVMEERFAEAEDYFARARKLFDYAQDQNGATEIINQQALTALICHDYARAAKLAAQAKKIFVCLKNESGMALSLDIAAQVAGAQNNWSKAQTTAAAASKLYAQNHNASAKLEMDFLQAQAWLELGKSTAAEKMLRQIISQGQHQAGCFHIANAYNLLGIIYLRNQDFRRAEGLFQQSLSAELQNERWCGAAIDYANIALTSYRRGHQESGDKNRDLALQYAKEANRQDLVNLLEEQINKIRVRP